MGLGAAGKSWPGKLHFLLHDNTPALRRSQILTQVLSLPSGSLFCCPLLLLLPTACSFNEALAGPSVRGA